MHVYRRQRSGKYATFGIMIGGGKVKRKSLFEVTVDPLNTIELPLDEDIVDPLNPGDDIGVTTFTVEEKQGLLL